MSNEKTTDENDELLDNEKSSEKKEEILSKYYPKGKIRYVTATTYAKLCSLVGDAKISVWTIYMRIDAKHIRYTKLEEADGLFIDLQLYPPVNKLQGGWTKGKKRKEIPVVPEFDLKAYITETVEEMEKFGKENSNNATPHDFKRILAERHQKVKDKINFQDFVQAVTTSK